MPPGQILTSHSTVKDSLNFTYRIRVDNPRLFKVKIKNHKILVNLVKSGGQISQEVSQIAK
jgi:hypothetical protein